MHIDRVIDTKFLRDDLLRALQRYMPSTARFPSELTKAPGKGELGNLFAALAVVFGDQEKRRLQVKFNSILNYAETDALDRWGTDLQLPRLTNETDNQYRSRIKREILAPRGTKASIITAVSILTGADPNLIQVYEPWRDLFVTDGALGQPISRAFYRPGTLSGKQKLEGGGYYRNGVIDVIVPTPANNLDSLEDVVNRTRAAGILYRVTLKTSDQVDLPRATDRPTFITESVVDLLGGACPARITVITSYRASFNNQFNSQFLKQEAPLCTTNPNNTSGYENNNVNSYSTDFFYGYCTNSCAPKEDRVQDCPVSGSCDYNNPFSLNTLGLVTTLLTSIKGLAAVNRVIPLRTTLTSTQGQTQPGSLSLNARLTSNTSRRSTLALSTQLASKITASGLLNASTKLVTKSIKIGVVSREALTTTLTSTQRNYIGQDSTLSLSTAPITQRARIIARTTLGLTTTLGTTSPTNTTSNLGLVQYQVGFSTIKQKSRMSLIALLDSAQARASTLALNTSLTSNIRVTQSGTLALNLVTDGRVLPLRTVLSSRSRLIVSSRLSLNILLNTKSPLALRLSLPGFGDLRQISTLGLTSTLQAKKRVSVKSVLNLSTTLKSENITQQGTLTLTIGDS
jgi:hypothetical protein